MAPDPKKRREIYKKASSIIWEDAPWIFLYVQKYTIVHGKNVKGIVILPVEKFNPIYATVE